MERRAIRFLPLMLSHSVEETTAIQLISFPIVTVMTSVIWWCVGVDCCPRRERPSSILGRQGKARQLQKAYLLGLPHVEEALGAGREHDGRALACEYGARLLGHVHQTPHGSRVLAQGLDQPHVLHDHRNNDNDMNTAAVVI